MACQPKMSGQLVTMAAALHAKDAPYLATLECLQQEHPCSLQRLKTYNVKAALGKRRETASEGEEIRGEVEFKLDSEWNN